MKGPFEEKPTTRTKSVLLGEERARDSQRMKGYWVRKGEKNSRNVTAHIKLKRKLKLSNKSTYEI